MLIPVMHCFDRNYIIPAAASMYSMMENADPSHEYVIHILHNDVTERQQALLRETVSVFPYVNLEFLDMNDRFESIFSGLANKGHFTKECFYKYLAAETFPQYERMIISDVDVIFLGDISRDFVDYNFESGAYLAGCKMPIRKKSWLYAYATRYMKAFEGMNLDIFSLAGGYYIFNLERMRQDNLLEKFVACSEENSHRLIQPEQDVINIVCHPDVVELPLDAMICSYAYDLYKTEADFANDVFYSADELKKALHAPIQLHFATPLKPWSYPKCARSEVWHQYIFRTPLARNYLATMAKRMKSEVASIEEKFTAVARA